MSLVSHIFLPTEVSQWQDNGRKQKKSRIKKKTFHMCVLRLIVIVIVIVGNSLAAAQDVYTWPA